MNFDLSSINKGIHGVGVLHNSNHIPAKSVIDSGTTQRHVRKVANSCLNRAHFEHDAGSMIGIFGHTRLRKEGIFIGWVPLRGAGNVVVALSVTGVSETSTTYAI